MIFRKIRNLPKVFLKSFNNVAPASIHVESVVLHLSSNQVHTAVLPANFTYTHGAHNSLHTEALSPLC